MIEELLNIFCFLSLTVDVFLANSFIFFNRDSEFYYVSSFDLARLCS